MTTRRWYQPPLGARMWKCPKWRQPAQITHLFICSQRNHNKYSCYHYKIKKKKKSPKQKTLTAEQLLCAKVDAASRACLVGSLWLQQCPRACWNVRKAWAERHSAYHRFTTRFTSCSDCSSRCTRAINYFHMVACQARPKSRLYTLFLLMEQTLKTKQATVSKWKTGITESRRLWLF